MKSIGTKAVFEHHYDPEDINQSRKPTQNAYIEHFNRTFREELLDQRLFLRLDDVREAIHW